MTGFIYTVITVFRKEMWEHFRTKRLIVIGAIFAFVYVLLALYGNIITGASTSGYNFERGANAVLVTVLAFTGFFPGLMAIVISYTAIVGERSRKSLILLTSKPVKRPALFLGKFLSSYFAIVLVYMVVMTLGYVGCIAASGKVPSLEEVGRAFGALAFVLFAMACWVAFAMFLSTYLKNPITVAVAAIMVWFLVMPIVSQIGFIYWMVSSGDDANASRNPDIGIIQRPGEPATVAFSGLESATYSLYNESGPLQGIGFQGYFTVSGVPSGNYSWTANGTGIKRLGTIVVDGLHTFSVSTGTQGLKVQASADQNVTVEKGGAPLAPSNVERFGQLRNYTYKGATDEVRVTITAQDRVLFVGNFTLESRAQRRMGGALSQTPPDYVKYNQLINPDSAMTGYEQVLNPNAKAGITAAEGATALAIFFLVFMFLGLLMFSKMEMV